MRSVMYIAGVIDVIIVGLRGLLKGLPLQRVNACLPACAPPPPWLASHFCFVMCVNAKASPVTSSTYQASYYFFHFTLLILFFVCVCVVPSYPPPPRHFPVCEDHRAGEQSRQGRFPGLAAG